YRLLRLLAASEAYQHTLAKKKRTETFDDSEKLMTIDRLGIVMVIHGEDFGNESVF
ncbi:hypothetical protein H0H93_004987, partial [Arthromyces matolae]